MAKRRSGRRKASGRQSDGLILLIVLVCLAVAFHEPIADALRNRRHAATQQAVVAEKKPATAAKKPAGRATATVRQAKALPDRTGVAGTAGNVLLPAPLENVPEQVLHRKGYTVSYNREHKIPNWVAWELTPEKLVERESRTDKFLPDPDLPESQAVTTDDYKRCGMDRGHMCPAGDNRWHWKAMQESFYMTNICPQNHNLNRGDWKELEEACRLWARREGKIYIVCGPVLYRQKHRTIGRKHKVTVPEAFFKVILCTSSTPPKAIGFIYKNTAGNHPLDAYVNSVDEVERITGIDFFPALPDDVEKQVEASCDLGLWKRQ
ncbi:DNA/RNA non-specific endonuclease [uncultured Bacteroides sp.]|uniref:DNA/RNA non-specific endonuclease n=1 Tax=uncultured Bacteroides sp. TaxID=162156 RepID=UPI0025F398F5|nr:DNA/RNA non-specific endonuclease [uncultured Bacteroides sp.]